jgi:outer membrane protein assembly factor BamB
MIVKNRVSRWSLPPIVASAFLMLAGPGALSPTTRAGDWPQWRGENRDGKVTGFIAPSTWPKELTQKWKVTVGEGVATPALVGDKLYVFSWDGGKEIIRCLEADSGKELWKDQYDAAKASGPASGFAGARCSPTVTEGKVVTLGVQGTLSCVDAASGKMIWRKDSALGHPQFFTSSSPVVVDGLCVAQFGGEKEGGGIAAYDLASGSEKWKWTGDGAAYASPVLLTVDGTKMVVAETAQSIVGIDITDGKLLWKVPYPKGAGRSYNASTPIVEGQIIIFSGASRGTKAIKIEKSGNEFKAKDLWNNKENSVIFNTPVIHNGLVFGLTANNDLFCINADGKTAWSSSTKGKGGYGSIVDTGSVLLSLTPSAQLVVYEPSDKEFKEVASYKVSSSETYAYPIVSGKRIYVKDKDSVIMYTIE